MKSYRVKEGAKGRNVTRYLRLLRIEIIDRPLTNFSEKCGFKLCYLNVYIYRRVFLMDQHSKEVGSRWGNQRIKHVQFRVAGRWRNVKLSSSRGFLIWIHLLLTVYPYKCKHSNIDLFSSKCTKKRANTRYNQFVMKIVLLLSSRAIGYAPHFRSFLSNLGHRKEKIA